MIQLKQKENMGNLGVHIKNAEIKTRFRYWLVINYFNIRINREYNSDGQAIFPHLTDLKIWNGLKSKIKVGINCWLPWIGY